MRCLLIVAYYFPPSGGPGVQRVLKYTKYLPQFGWEPIVLTVENGQFPAIDPSLLKEIPTEAKVYRTKIFEPYDLYRIVTGKPKDVSIDVNVIRKDEQKVPFKEKIAEFIRATFFIPDARMGWLLTAKRKAIEIIDEFKVDAVYSSSPPYTCSLVARYVKKKRQIPWVAGFRDPWTGFISAPRRWWLPAKIDNNLEHSVFKEANFVEVAWEGIAKDALLKYPTLEKKKFIHIPNGFDSSDFPPISYVRNEKFSLTYTGSMYGRRNPQSLFNAIELLISKREISPTEFTIRLIGRFGSEIYEMIDKTSFKEAIEVIGYLPHSESLSKLMQSDALLLIVDESKESQEIVPGKVFEYLGTGRPILAICPTNGAVADLISATNSGLIAHQSETDNIANNFLILFNSWKSGSDFTPNFNEIRKYERREHTKKLANLLNSLVEAT